MKVHIKKYWTSFRGKLTALVVCAILIPMTISSVMLGVMLEKQLQESFENRMEAELKTFSLILNAREEELTQGLLRVASDNTLQMTLNLKIIPQLRKYLDTQIKVLGFSSLVVADAQKKILATSGKTISKFIEDNDESQLITIGRDTLISHSKPIFKNNELMGYVLGAVNLKESGLLEFLSEQLIDNYAIWTTGEVVASDLKTEDLDNNFQFNTDGNIMNSITSENKFRILTEKLDFGNRDLALSILLPLKEKSKKFRIMIGIISVVVLSLFLIILILLKLFMKELINPVNQLTLAAASIDKGEQIPPLDDSRNDEFGKMAFTFKKMVEKLKQMAYYDQLTNLPNRSNFAAYLGRMLKRTKWKSDYLFAVLFIDLDRFKVVNDSLGHIIGDKLLVEVARRLEDCTRPTDNISRVAGSDKVSRFGGDEFAVFLNDVKDISSASRVADRIQIELQKPFNLDGHELFTSASIGIALSATGYENEENILRDADSAMYRAKATGKAHAEIFDEAMHVRVSQILQLESDLRTAVEKEQFTVYYQPIVSATDRRITGAEALVRWNHPEQGFISPMDFIPIAEEIGLISTIGEWVLRTACAQNKAWQDAGYPNLLMKVNFSSRQFKNENLAELVKKVIRETGISAPLLDVEITETIAMEKGSIRILNQLTDMGLQTSIDDFGTGYSSLGSLTQFSINTIKIDRAFVKEITIDVNAKAIIKAIIAMAHSLNMEVVAEGVETEDQLAFLQSHQCDKIQGYLFSRPVPEEEFRKLLEKEKNGSPIIQEHFKAIA